MTRASRSARARRGLTLVELLLAVGLLSLLVIAVVRLLDTSLGILERTERRRDLLEAGSAIVDLVAGDLVTAEPGSHGDLVFDWTRVDLDGDGIANAPLGRLRLVRRASPGETSIREGGALGGAPDGSLVEVVWTLLPEAVDPDDPGRAERLGRCVLVRGERPAGAEGISVFSDEFFRAGNRPPPDATREVAAGLLWFAVGFAGQTTTLDGGWEFGDALADAGRAWDAWNRHRPDPERHPWNARHPGMPSADVAPILPRRVRIELEIERERDLLRRPRLVDLVERDETAIRVSDGDRLPGPGAFVLIGEEWMRILSVHGNEAGVQRGERGSRAGEHPAGATVHHGHHVLRDVPMPAYREEWDL